MLSLAPIFVLLGINVVSGISLHTCSPHQPIRHFHLERLHPVRRSAKCQDGIGCKEDAKCKDDHCKKPLHDGCRAVEEGRFFHIPMYRAHVPAIVRPYPEPVRFIEDTPRFTRDPSLEDCRPVCQQYPNNPCQCNPFFQNSDCSCAPCNPYCPQNGFQWCHPCFPHCCPSHPGCCPSHPGYCPSHPGCCPSHPGCCPSHPGCFPPRFMPPCFHPYCYQNPCFSHAFCPPHMPRFPFPFTPEPCNCNCLQQ